MRGRTLLSALCIAAASKAPALAAAKPTPTPTARARLSGGFGRPRATVTPGGPDSGGQSMADVVRAAHDARDASATASDNASGSEKGKGVVIDNRSLVTDPSKGRVSTSRIVATHAPTPAKAGPAPAAAATPNPGGPTPAAAAGGTPAPTEAEWKGIADAARKRVADAKARVAELDATTKKLENDFYAWDDGQYRDRVIKPSWDRSRQQLDEAKAELAAADKELSDLPERARRAGALPGWIRE